jgi:hypothetical protein
VNNLPTGALHSQHSTHYRDSLIRGCGDVFGVRARVFSFFGFSRQNMLFSISVLASMRFFFFMLCIFSVFFSRTAAPYTREVEHVLPLAKRGGGGKN